MENKVELKFENNNSATVVTDKEKMGFDISIVAPAVELTETQQASINTIVGSDTVTIMNLSEAELNNQLDKIIGGEQ